METAYEGRGKVGVVVPHGVLFRGGSEGRIRKQTIKENLLEAVIGLPSKLFMVQEFLLQSLFLIEQKSKNVLFIDASKEFGSGKNQNILREEDIEHIVSIYRRFLDEDLQPGVVEDKYAYVASPEEIKENDFNLNIPRYVDTFEEEEEIDIKAVQKEINCLEAELKEVREKMNEYLKELDLI